MKFLERQKLLNSHQEKMHNIVTTVPIRDKELIVLFQKRKYQAQMVSLVNSTKHLFKKKKQKKSLSENNVIQKIKADSCCCSIIQSRRLFATPWTAVRQTSLPSTVSRNLLELLSIESIMPSNYFILCHPLLLLPSIFPSIGVFSNELAFHIRWPKYRTLPNSLYEASITLTPKQIKALQVGKTTEEHLW